MSSIPEEAYSELYPGESMPELDIRYSGKFKGYNALVRYRPGAMVFSLSKKWRGVEREIQVGLVQSLILRARKDRRKSIKIDMYNIFLKKVGATVGKDQMEPELLQSFVRVNEKYFGGMFEAPNLVFGTESYRKLGSYDYGQDTITISLMLKGHDDLIDYVMHHELLHKKHKFMVKGNRSYHHTQGFRSEEQQFERHKEIEGRITELIKRKRFRWF
jgi:hypothetical protein